MILPPGLIDLHCHGGGDSNFMDGTVDDILTAARAHLMRVATMPEGPSVPGSLECPLNAYS